MPSNAQAKGGSQNQPKPAASKNASIAPVTKAVKPTAASVQPVKSAEAKIAGKNAPQAAPLAGQTPPAATAPAQEFTEDVGNGISVNKKKQKRRQKEAARRAAEAPTQLAQDFANAAEGLNGYYDDSDYENTDQYEPQEGKHLYYTPDGD
ncbi:hypothetical protein P7C71_g6566, partial [Lecanoromycetidae sp. Uapishka_2]